MPELRIEKTKLRDRVKTAGSWVLASYVGSQLTRFASNLILTRLLFPEAFGLMAIVYTIGAGVTMLSDLGISQSIIVHRDGDKADYLNTAWTMQILKGVLVAAVLAASAPFAAAHYQHPELELLVYIIAFSAIVDGLRSTKIATTDRNIQARRRFFVDLSVQVAGTLVTILLAALYRSPVSLAVAAAISSGFTVIASHLLLPGPNNRLHWNPAAARSIARFGATVMFGSAMAYFVGEGNKLLSASFLTVRVVGLIGLASVLSMMLTQAVQSVAGRVLFPAYSEVYRDGDIRRLSSVVERSRAMQVAVIVPASIFLVFFGHDIVALLYDKRYADAGTILEIGALGALIGSLSQSYSGVLWAMGKGTLDAGMLAIRAAILWTSMTVGFHLAGPIGMIIGSAASNWIVYPVVSLIFMRHKIWHPRLDLPVLLLAAVVTATYAMRADWPHLLTLH